MIKETENINGTLQVQKEARERELSSAKEMVGKLQTEIYKKDQEIYRLMAYVDEGSHKEKEVKELRKQLENIKIIQNHQHDEELESLREFKYEYENSYQKLTSEYYALKSQSVVVLEKIKNFEKENKMLNEKISHMANASMKIYLYLINLDNDSQLTQDFKTQQQDHILSLFDTSEFYKNGYYELVREKLAFIVKQRDELRKVLNQRNTEMASIVAYTNISNDLNKQKNQMKYTHDNEYYSQNRLAMSGMNLNTDRQINSDREIALNLYENTQSQNAKIRSHSYDTREASYKFHSSEKPKNFIVSKQEIQDLADSASNLNEMSKLNKLKNQNSTIGSLMAWGDSKVSKKDSKSFTQPFTKQPNIKIMDSPKQFRERQDEPKQFKNTFHYDYDKRNSVDGPINHKKMAPISNFMYDENEEQYAMDSEYLQIFDQKEILQNHTQERITFPSNQLQVDNKDQILKLETMLVNLNRQKQNLEHLITKFPSKGGKCVRDIKHRQSVEMNLEMIENNITQVRRQLREYKVL